MLHAVHIRLLTVLINFCLITVIFASASVFCKKKRPHPKSPPMFSNETKSEEAHNNKKDNKDKSTQSHQEKKKKNALKSVHGLCPAHSNLKGQNKSTKCTPNCHLLPKKTDSIEDLANKATPTLNNAPPDAASLVFEQPTQLESREMLVSSLVMKRRPVDDRRSQTRKKVKTDKTRKEKNNGGGGGELRDEEESSGVVYDQESTRKRMKSKSEVASVVSQNNRGQVQMDENNQYDFL
ncbi:unnamed protein product [Caenorhabditis auriculariae]|uniref:Uncharacterized protein n=1 Tax=Caenorhabditis auriculariae TaxID=2777116 RepID=A0A8S1H038_9PELO|nr:unnamed protein product [Caenorhabditis auriculariae]